MKISSFFLPFFHFKIDVRVKHLDVQNTKYVTFCLPLQLILGSISFIIRDSSPRMLHRSLYYIAAQCLYESCQFSFDQYPDLRYYGCLNTTLPLVLNAYYAMDPIQYPLLGKILATYTSIHIVHMPEGQVKNPPFKRVKVVGQ